MADFLQTSKSIILTELSPLKSAVFVEREPVNSFLQISKSIRLYKPLQSASPNDLVLQFDEVVGVGEGILVGTAVGEGVGVGVEVHILPTKFGSRYRAASPP